MSDSKRDSDNKAQAVEVCVQHGNSWIALHNGQRRIVQTIPVELASAIKAQATTHTAMQRRLEAITVAAAAVLKRDGDTACKCIHISRQAEREYESGTCPHQRLALILRDGKGDGVSTAEGEGK